MKTTAEMIEVMQAYERGETIEFYHGYEDKWKYCSDPIWNWLTTDYRIAIKPKKTLELYQWLCKDSKGYYTVSHCEQKPCEAVKRLDDTKITVEVDNV